MTQRILELCRSLGAAQEKEELLLALIETVQGQLAGQLREGISPEDCGSAFPLAAAMTAMERLSALAGGGDEVTSFTAGELTIRRESGKSQTGNLSRQARELLAPWLGDTGFVFRGVDG